MDNKEQKVPEGEPHRGDEQRQSQRLGPGLTGLAGLTGGLPGPAGARGHHQRSGSNSSPIASPTRRRFPINSLRDSSIPSGLAPIGQHHDRQSSTVTTDSVIASLPRVSSGDNLLKAAAPFAGRKHGANHHGGGSTMASPSIGADTDSTITDFLKPPVPSIDPHLSRDFKYFQRAESTTGLDIIEDYLEPRTRSNSVSSQLSVDFAPENVGGSRAHRPEPLKHSFHLPRPARSVFESSLSPVLSVKTSSPTVASPTTPARLYIPATPESLSPVPSPTATRPADDIASSPTAKGAAAKAADGATGADGANAGAKDAAGDQPGEQAAGSAGKAAAQPGDAPPGPLNDPRNKKKLAAKREKFGQSIRNFIRIFSYTTRRDRFFIGVSAFAAIGTGLTFPAMTIIFGNMVGNITSPATHIPTADIQQFMTDIIHQSVLYMLYLFIVRFTLGYVAILGFNVMSIRVSSALRLAYLKALLGQRVSMLDTQPPGQLAAIITSTANTVQSGISEKLAHIVQAVALMIGAMANAFYHSWKLTVVTSSGLLLIIICYCCTTPFIVKNMKEVEDLNMKASGVASEAFGSVKMIAACGAEAKMVKKYDAWISGSRLRGMRLSKITGVQKSVIFFSIIGTFALSCWFASQMIVKGEIPNVSILIIVLMCVMMTTNTIGDIAQPLAAASQAASSSRILFNGIDAPKPNTEGKKEPDVSASEKIVLWNVNFTYPTRPKQKILDQLKLVIPAGKVTAIVGPSGSGKSTIVNLIERWYELDGAANGNKIVQFFRNGSIKCGGVPLHEIDLKWWRSQIGLVQQEPFLFNDTIFANVAYGLIGTEWEDAEEEKKRELVLQACKEAFADEFVSRLPDGYDTPVGESGTKLSGGQRQRLAIARAIVKQPKILILDEATSAIDVRGEKVVQAALDKASKGRTTIMIAHRLSTVKKADNIIVMGKGKVQQWGKHAQLMAKKQGPYWLLTQAQQLTMGKEADATEEKSEITEEETRTMDVMTLDEKKDGSQENSEEEDEEESIAQKSKGAFRVFGSMIGEQRQHWPWYVIMFSGAVVAGASSPTQAYLFAALLSTFSLWDWGDYLLMLTNFWCLMFVILAGSVGIGYFALGFASTRLAFIITTSYQKEYFRNIISKPVSWFDGEEMSVGALTARLATDSAALQQLLGTNMAFVVIAILSVTGCLTVAFYFGWKLTAVSLSCAMPLAIAAGFFRSRAEKKFNKMNNKVFAESAKFATESMGAIRTVTALTLEDTICRRYEKLLDDHTTMAFKRARLATIIFSASDSVPLLCMAFILWYGGGLLVSGEYWSFQYLVVYIAMVQGAMGVGQWLSFIPNISAATMAANRVQEMRIKDIDATKGLKMNDGALELDEKDESQGPKIRLQDVWFRYPTRDVPVLCGLDMTIEKGQFAAIVGPSGCGKTSVISLLERYYKVKSGSISFNGVDIDDICLRDYRKMISLVAQEAYMFQGSIRENILLGVDDPEAVSDEELYQACRDAEIHDFVISLPEGYNTRVGFKGILLSGGQKQRMSIARALIRSPRLLLLDEATSALDSETEKLVQQVFERTKKSRTMVVVAHRLATIQNADIIFVLGEGNVVEQGTHAQLLAKRGMYWSMCQAQALDR